MESEPFAPTPIKKVRTTNIINLRLRDAGLEWLDEKQTQHSVCRSEVIKAALAYAATRPEEFGALIERRKTT